MGKGAVPGLSLLYNALLTAFRQGMVRFGMINRRAAARFTAECIADFDVRCGGVNQPVTGLSGGNLQKFITGREILQAPKLLLVCHPTRGVDVGAAHRVRQSIIDLRDKGAAILVISEDLDELFEMCDRIVVMAQGHVSPSKRISETSRGEIGMWMGGLFPGGPVRVHPEAGPV